jgi:hypothetical protein
MAISPSETPQKRISPSIRYNSVISAAAKEVDESETAKKISIYGAVSTADIAANLKAILAEDKVGARVILSPENISFVKETGDKDRVKQVGVFEIEIRHDGAPDSIRRTIRVNAKD